MSIQNRKKRETEKKKKKKKDEVRTPNPVDEKINYSITFTSLI